MRPAVKKMMELIRPTIHSSAAVLSMLNSRGNDKLAPLEPVWSQPCVAAPTAHRPMEYQSILGPYHLWSLSYMSAARSSWVSSGMVSMFSGSRATRAARLNKSAWSLMPLDSAKVRASKMVCSLLLRFWQVSKDSQDDRKEFGVGLPAEGCQQEDY
jgi:hypothetical protein